MHSERTQRGQQLALRPGGEVGLALGADLHERDLGEARLDERLDLLDVLVDVRAARELLGDLLGRDELGRGLEALGVGQIGIDLPAQAEPAELLVARCIAASRSAS